MLDFGVSKLLGWPPRRQHDTRGVHGDPALHVARAVPGPAPRTIGRMSTRSGATLQTVPGAAVPARRGSVDALETLLRRRPRPHSLAAELPPRSTASAAGACQRPEQRFQTAEEFQAARSSRSTSAHPPRTRISRCEPARRSRPKGTRRRGPRPTAVCQNFLPGDFSRVLMQYDDLAGAATNNIEARIQELREDGVDREFAFPTPFWRSSTTPTRTCASGCSASTTSTWPIFRSGRMDTSTLRD